MDLADLVGAAGVEEDTLGGSGFARVDVGHDPDIAGMGEVVRFSFFDFVLSHKVAPESD